MNCCAVRWIEGADCIGLRFRHRSIQERVERVRQIEQTRVLDFRYIRLPFVPFVASERSYVSCYERRKKASKRGVGLKESVKGVGS